MRSGLGSDQVLAVAREFTAFAAQAFRFSGIGRGQNYEIQERFEGLLRACPDFTPAQIVGEILAALTAFVQDCSQMDDMTLVILRVKTEANT